MILIGLTPKIVLFMSWALESVSNDSHEWLLFKCYSDVMDI